MVISELFSNMTAGLVLLLTTVSLGFASNSEEKQLAFYSPNGSPQHHCTPTTHWCNVSTDSWAADPSTVSLVAGQKSVLDLSRLKPHEQLYCLTLAYRIPSNQSSLFVLAAGSLSRLFSRSGDDAPIGKWVEVAVPVVGGVLLAGTRQVAVTDIQVFDSSCMIEEQEHWQRVPFYEHKRQKRDTSYFSTSFGSHSVKLWPNGVIPFEIGIGFDDNQRQSILHSMAIVNSTTCVQFVRRLAMDRDYIKFTSAESGCSAEVGYRPGRTEITLSDECFEFNGIKHVSHEILHVLGLFHEHQRPDRDQYVTVMTSNIQPASLINFAKASYMDWRILKTHYDYQSVLHYSNTEYVHTPGLQSLVARASPSMELGNKVGPTYTDLQKVANLYCNGRMGTSAHRYKYFRPRAAPSPPSGVQLWPNGEMPVQLAANLNSTHRLIILSVMAKLSMNTCLRFVQKQSHHRNYVRLSLGSHCSSNMGMAGFGRQTILLGPESGGCLSFGRVTRFLMLAAGVPYEHRRSDRDAYVRLRLNNLNPLVSAQGFDKSSETDPRILAVPYDYQSIMHWPKNYGAQSPELNTIEARGMPSLQLSNSYGPTSLDLLKLSKLYCRSQLSPIQYGIIQANDRLASNDVDQQIIYRNPRRRGRGRSRNDFYDTINPY